MTWYDLKILISLFVLCAIASFFGCSLAFLLFG